MTTEAPEHIEMLPQWESFPRHAANRPAVERMVCEEINRLYREGYPVLTAILQQIDRDDLKYYALDLISRGATMDGDAVDFPQTVMLRLRAGAKPPKVDCNGRDVLDGSLVAKIGNTGGEIPNLQAGPIGTNATKRRQLQATRKLYKTAKITKAGVMLPLSQAVTVLRMYGVGIAMQIKKHRQDPAGTVYQDMWLVEEVPAQVDAGEPEASEPKSKKNAA